MTKFVANLLINERIGQVCVYDVAGTVPHQWWLNIYVTALYIGSDLVGNSLCVQFGSNFSSEQTHKISIFGYCRTFSLLYLYFIVS